MKPIQIDCVGYQIAADLYEGKSDGAVLLNLIGFTSNKAKYAEFMNALVERTGVTALAIDYSGHGESPFKLEELTAAQHFLEVITAFDWLKEYYPNKKVWVMGASYGGFMATQLTKYRQFDKLVLRVPAIYQPHEFYDKWTKDRIEDDERKEYRKTGDGLDDHPLLKRAAGFMGKTLVVTHELDDICPPNSTMPFVRAFKADHWDAKGFMHSFGQSDITEQDKQDYYNKVADWLKK